MRRKSERLTVEDSLHVDTDRLYGPLKNAITRRGVWQTDIPIIFSAPMVNAA